MVRTPGLETRPPNHASSLGLWKREPGRLTAPMPATLVWCGVVWCGEDCPGQQVALARFFSHL